MSGKAPEDTTKHVDQPKYTMEGLPATIGEKSSQIIPEGISEPKTILGEQAPESNSESVSVIRKSTIKSHAQQIDKINAGIQSQNYAHMFSRVHSGLQSSAQSGLKIVQTGAQTGLNSVQAGMQNGLIDSEVYFVGPINSSKHSRWPMFLRLHGSVLPLMILPLLFMFIWSTMLTAIFHYQKKASTNSVLLTVLGFLVALSLSFRSSTAYERYSEGRKLWTQLTLCSNVLARIIWVHNTEREGKLHKKDLLAKLSALNLLKAFAVALKHRLLFDPYTNHEDLSGLIGHLDTFAHSATIPEAIAETPKKPIVQTMEKIGAFLGLPFLQDNPRKLFKHAISPVGNLPLEILTYLGSYLDEIVQNNTLKVPIQQTIAYNSMSTMNEILTSTERIVNTPLPLAYSIAISQITWLYVIMLPLQLYSTLGWVTIPACLISTYIILGILTIGRKIENPFGTDVNDLPLDLFCETIAREIDVISSKPKPKLSDWVESENNLVMFPVSNAGYPSWLETDEDIIAEDLKRRTAMSYGPPNPAAAPEQSEVVVVKEVVGDENV